MEEDHETRRKIIRQWMALPKDKRQTEEQVVGFAKKAVEQNEFHRSRRDPDHKFRRDPYQKVMGWLMPRASKSWSGSTAAFGWAQRPSDRTQGGAWAQLIANHDSFCLYAEVPLGRRPTYLNAITAERWEWQMILSRRWGWSPIGRGQVSKALIVSSHSLLNIGSGR
jgi:hypothetical protein